MVSEADFHPLADGPSLFDAVYNARLHPQKRHELSIEVASCAMIFLHTSMESAAYERELIARHNREAPGHRFVNEFRDGVPVLLSAPEVNRIYNQSSVGLALSAVEGAMFSSMEYMLSGLPVVSTANRGGRDVYFDDDFCITTEADPRAIREAVAALKDRKIPRHYIRERTLEKVERDRARFRELLSAVVERSGGTAPKIAGWPFANKLLTWKPWEAHFADIRARRRTGLRPTNAAR
jgi:glycosyltransferase involved in cell wall biosynthesis